MLKSPLEPPRPAVWLLDLFTPAEQAEAIPGDLLEEFREIAALKGASAARRWYLRQSAKTAAHLLAAQLSQAPWLTAATAIGGLFLLWFANQYTNRAAWAILLEYDSAIYAHVSAGAFYFTYRILLGCVIEPAAIAWLAGTLAKERALAVSLMMSLVATFPLVSFNVFLATHKPKFPVGFGFPLQLAAPPAAILLAAVWRLKTRQRRASLA